MDDLSRLSPEERDRYDKKMEELAVKLGGRRVPMDETPADRERIQGQMKKNRTPVPTFKSKEERQKFYMDYIPALYWVEIEGKDPDDLNRADFDFFWYAFTLGVQCLEMVKESDKKEESDMDG